MPKSRRSAWRRAPEEFCARFGCCPTPGAHCVELLLRVFPTAQLGLWIIVGADLVRARIWEHAADQGVWMRVLNPYVDIVATTFDGRLPVDAIACLATPECLRSSPSALQAWLSRSEPP